MLQLPPKPKNLPVPLVIMYSRTKTYNTYVVNWRTALLTRDQVWQRRPESMDLRLFYAAFL